MGWQDRPYYRDEHGGVPPVVFSFPKLTRMTMVLIGTCLAVYLVQSFTRETGFVERWFRLTFAGGRAFTQPWRWVTYQYLHGGAGHFFFNMIGLYFFLPSLEMMWGWKKALAFYTAGGAFAGLTYGLMMLVMPQYAVGGLIGASGAVLAAMGAIALLSPQRQLILLFFPLPIRTAVALFGAFYLLSTVADRNPSDAAHLGGLAFGFIAPYLAGPQLARFRRKWESRQIRREQETGIQEQQMVDRILQKVHDTGMNSLTWTERRALKRATERQRQSDLARARRGR